MKNLLRIFRISAVIIWFIIVAIMTFPFQFMGKKGRNGILKVSRLWAKGTTKIIGLNIRINGSIPKEGTMLIVSNHLSYLDIITHGSLFLLRHSPKRQIKKWPFLGWFIMLSQPVWIDRKSRSASLETSKRFVDTLHSGVNLIVYPEGTSSDGTNGMLPFKSTPFDAAINADVPVLPILTRYPEKAGQQTPCWYGDMTLLPHVWTLLGYPSTDVEIDIYDPIYPNGMSRKEMAQHTFEVMSDKYDGIFTPQEETQETLRDFVPDNVA